LSVKVETLSFSSKSPNAPWTSEKSSLRLVEPELPEDVQRKGREEKRSWLTPRRQDAGAPHEDHTRPQEVGCVARSSPLRALISGRKSEIGAIARHLVGQTFTTRSTPGSPDVSTGGGGRNGRRLRRHTLAAAPAVASLPEEDEEVEREPISGKGRPPPRRSRSETSQPNPSFSLAKAAKGIVGFQLRKGQTEEEREKLPRKKSPPPSPRLA